MFLDCGDYVKQISCLFQVDDEYAFYIFEEIQDAGLFNECETYEQCKSVIFNYRKRKIMGKAVYSSEDTEIISEILLKMGASFKSFEKRGDYHVKGWVINKDGVGVCWIIFERGNYSSIRFHRSVYEFNCEELELRLENMQLKRGLAQREEEFFSAHSELKALKELSKKKGKRVLFRSFLNVICKPKK